MHHNGETFELCEEFMDIGYMAENFEATSCDGELQTITRSNPERIMTLLISFPSAKAFEHEIGKIDAFMSRIQIDIHCYIVFASSEECDFVRLQKFERLIDHDGEFGAMYGVQIINGSLEGKLTKSLFLIGKDGSIFWLDIPHDLSHELNLDRLQIELNRAYTSYTGVGCHA